MLARYRVAGEVVCICASKALRLEVVRRRKHNSKSKDMLLMLSHMSEKIYR